MGCNLVFDRVLPGQPAGLAGSHRVMDFFIFSSTPPGSSPWPAGSPVDPTGQAEFQNYALEGLINNYFSFFSFLLG
jgi:hypothetical protein